MAETAAQHDVRYASADGTPLAGILTTPAGRADVPVALLAHGGAWQRGAPTDYLAWARLLAGRGIASLAAPYRHATPEHPSWPGCRDDVIAAVAFLVEHGPGRGVDPTRLVLMGTSAGAHLVSLVQLSGGADARLVVAANGVYDLVEQHDHAERAGGGNSVRILMGSTPETDADAYRAASPLQWVGAGRAARARWLVISGDADDLVPPHLHSVPFAAALESAGADVHRVSIPGAGHVWHTTTPVDEGANLQMQPALWRAIEQALAPV
jgi:acetyl esterase/lipase